MKKLLLFLIALGFLFVGFQVRALTLPDLVPSIDPILEIKKDIKYNFTMNIRNEGVVPAMPDIVSPSGEITSYGFYNNLEVVNGKYGNGSTKFNIGNISPHYISYIPESSSVSLSAFASFDKVGDYSIRLCADSSREDNFYNKWYVNESNKLNNCTEWINFSVVDDTDTTCKILGFNSSLREGEIINRNKDVYLFWKTKNCKSVYIDPIGVESLSNSTGFKVNPTESIIYTMAAAGIDDSIDTAILEILVNQDSNINNEGDSNVSGTEDNTDTTTYFDTNQCSDMVYPDESSYCIGGLVSAEMDDNGCFTFSCDMSGNNTTGGGYYDNPYDNGFGNNYCSGSITNRLKFGSNGEEVKKLQEILNSKGFLSYNNITGYFGYYTETSLKRFQKANNLPETGETGPQTIFILNDC